MNYKIQILSDSCNGITYLFWNKLKICLFKYKFIYGWLYDYIFNDLKIDYWIFILIKFIDFCPQADIVKQYWKYILFDEHHLIQAFLSSIIY